MALFHDLCKDQPVRTVHAAAAAKDIMFIGLVEAGKRLPNVKKLSDAAMLVGYKDKLGCFSFALDEANDGRVICRFFRESPNQVDKAERATPFSVEEIEYADFDFVNGWGFRAMEHLKRLLAVEAQITAFCRALG